jgi:hypothetical protein
MLHSEGKFLKLEINSSRFRTGTVYIDATVRSVKGRGKRGIDSHHGKHIVGCYPASSGRVEEVMFDGGSCKKVCDCDRTSYKHIEICLFSEERGNLPTTPNHEITGTTTTLKFRFQVSHSRWIWGRPLLLLMREHRQFATHNNCIPD